MILGVLGHARILLETTRGLKAALADPALSEFVRFVGGNELVADLRSLERIAQSMREDVGRYLEEVQRR